MSLSVRVCVFLLLQFICFRSVSQVASHIQHYSTAQGLSDNRITDITKDSEGFMWFGSWAGISRFDGYHFLTFKSYPGDRSSLKSNRIDEIVEDSGRGHLWLRAYDKQVYRFDKRSQKFESLTELGALPSMASISFSRILAVQANKVWLKTENNGILLVSNSAASRPRVTFFSKSRQEPCHLPSNNISFFFSDKHSNVWIGTDAGLRILKKGGSSGYSMRSPAGTDKLAFRGICETAGRIWLSTETGPLLSVSKAGAQLRTYPEVTGVHHMVPVRGLDKLYCTTSAGKLLRVQPDGRVESLFHSPDQSALFYVYQDRSGVLWIESASFGLIRFDPRTNSSETLFPREKYPFSPNLRNVTIFQDKNGTVWVRLKGQLRYYNDKKGGLEQLTVAATNYSSALPANITRTFYDPAGVLWIGNGVDGIDKVMFREQEFKQYVHHAGNVSREANETRGILADRRGRLWLATKAGELLLYRNGSRIANPLQQNPQNLAGIYCILEDRRGRVWMGTKSNGLIRATPLDTTAARYSISQYQPDKRSAASISSNSIYCLLEDSKGRLWAGSFEEGLILIEDKDGRTNFKTVRNSFRTYPGGGFLKIRHMAEDGGGRIWIGTTAGLLIFDPNSPGDHYTFRQYKKEPGNIRSLGGNDIQFIFRDSRKQMWVLSTTGGLNLAEGADPMQSLSFVNYSGRDGLPSDFLLSCAEDAQRNLWIATQNGISKFSIPGRKFQNFNYIDGIQEAGFSEASCAKMAGGELVFGNSAGYLTFDPAKIQTRKISAPLAFTNLQINSQDVVPGPGSPLLSSVNNTSRVELKYDQNLVSIDFAVLDFHAVDKQNYACRLVGFDNEWRSTEGQRRATYTKLPPGKYVFEVKSLNDELYQKPPFRSLQITILPPPWKTWWAYTAYFIIAAIVFFMIRRVAVTMFKLRQGIEVERKLADLKLNFFTQISHELRTPLTLIINPSEEVMVQENLSGKGREYMSVVVKNARRMLRMVNQVLDLRKIQSGNTTMNISRIDLNSFITGMLEYFRETISRRNLHIGISRAQESLSIHADVDKLEIVFYNLLANAIKFSPDGGAISIKLGMDEAQQWLRVEVADQGPGVLEDELEDIFELYYEGKQREAKYSKGTGIGLALSRELVALQGGRIYAEHNQPCGLKVILELKADQETSDKQQSQQSGNIFSPEAIGSKEGEAEDRGDLAGLPLVLIVEDNDDLRAFLASKFSDFYRVETAANGGEGVEKARALLPDLVLSDIMMPELDGIQLLDRLKNSPETSHIPVVLLTARYSVESQIESLKYGADYYITKPFRMDLLQAAVMGILSQRKKLFHALQNHGQSAEEAPDVSITAYDRQFLEKIIGIVESKLEDSDFNIEDVADSIGMSRSAFYKKFKSLTDTAPVEFVRETRLKKARQLFDEGEDNVSSAAYAVGFNNPKYFSTCFKAQYQQTPTEYLRSIRKPVKGTAG